MKIIDLLHLKLADAQVILDLVSEKITDDNVAHALHIVTGYIEEVHSGLDMIELESRVETLEQFEGTPQ